MKTATNMVWNASMLAFALFFTCIAGVGIYDGVKADESLFLIVQHNAQGLLALSFIALLYLPHPWRVGAFIIWLLVCGLYVIYNLKAGAPIETQPLIAAFIGFGGVTVFAIIRFFRERGHKRTKA